MRKEIYFLIITILIVTAIAIWLKPSNKLVPPGEIACTMEAKICPDGSSVGRTGPNCEFSPCPQVNSSLTEDEAKTIAAAHCVKGGEVLGSGTYNENSKTWWFDANLNATRPGCNPACVVDETTKTATINWRCTGLIP